MACPAPFRPFLFLAACLPLALPLLCGPAAAGDGGHSQLHRDRVVGQTAIPVYGYRVAATYPHDPASYTEGLVIADGRLYEGTGLYGRSRLREIDLATGRVRREVLLGSRYFGEGVTVLGDRVYQLTYLSNTAFVYDRRTFRRLGTFTYASQGWGLTTDGRLLYKSNGSASIQVLDPKTFRRLRAFVARDGVGPVGFLNELEWVEGRIYANVWQSDFIAIIQPGDGRVVGWIDLTGLNPDPKRLVYPYVLNGIAWNPRTRRPIVTGKGWPKLYEIDLVRRR